jgi:hypothetical protein
MEFVTSLQEEPAAESAESGDSTASADAETEPVWYNFIVNEELDSWAIVATYDPSY